MKFCLQKHGILLFGGLCCIFSSASAGDEVPSGFAVERYASLWQHSPFTIASVMQDAAPAGFAQNLAIVGIAKIGDKDLVTLLNKQSLERFIVKAAPNEQGIKVISVETDADPLKTSVMIQRDGEIAKVGFDKALIDRNQPAAPQANSNAVPVPGQPPAPLAENTPPVPARRVRRIPAIPALNPAPPGAAPQASSSQ
jgi:hypothetical protein